MYFIVKLIPSIPRKVYLQCFTFHYHPCQSNRCSKNLVRYKFSAIRIWLHQDQNLPDIHCRAPCEGRFSQQLHLNQDLPGSISVPSHVLLFHIEPTEKIKCDYY